MHRRSFLKAVGGAAGACSFAGSVGALSALAGQQASAIEANDYKALVCVFFKGGQDQYDTIIPYDADSYGQFARYRRGILSRYAKLGGRASRARHNLTPIHPVNQEDFTGRRFGFPRVMDKLTTLFTAGNAALVANVGPLRDPHTNAQTFKAKTVPLPKKIFSHLDQQAAWMKSETDIHTSGWGGRFSDLVKSADINKDDVFNSISMAGDTMFLHGDMTSAYSVRPIGTPPVVKGFRGNKPFLLGTGKPTRRARELLKQHYQSLNKASENLFYQDMAGINERTFANNDLFRIGYRESRPLNTPFPKSKLGQRLQAIARIISIHSALGCRRQIFYVTLGRFDTHDDQAEVMTELQEDYADCFAAFYQATVEIGLQKNVTLFTASDFGRALPENGNGTDHGWGGHHFVVGGAVKGNRIYGEMPPVALGHAYDAGHGRLVPQISVEQYAATMGRWFGLGDSELSGALPALKNFKTRNLGFMT